MALAGMLEIADREFQAIQDADRQITVAARKMVKSGELSGVEITPDALKLFLDQRLGTDARISDWGYDWTTRMVKKLGFRDLKQLETAIAGYNDRQLSGLATGGQQGQTTRFEYMLLAALGEKFTQRHPWSSEEWFQRSSATRLAKFQEHGIKISTHDPLAS